MKRNSSKRRNPDRATAKSRVPGEVVCESRIHPHLTNYIGYCLHKVGLRLRAQIDARVSRYGLVAPQYGMLIILQLEGLMNQNELGSYMAMDKATIVRMLDGLEDKGFIRRVPSPEDRRAKLVEVTPSGRRVISELEKLRQEAEKEFLAPLSPDERKLLREMVLKLLR